MYINLNIDRSKKFKLREVLPTTIADLSTILLGCCPLLGGVRGAKMNSRILYNNGIYYITIFINII